MCNITKKIAEIHKTKRKQECIPVGCIPPAAVAIPGGPPVTQRPDPPRDQAPPGPGTPTRPGTLPEPGTHQDQVPPSPLWTDTTCKYIILPQTSFAGGNYQKNSN